MQANMSYASSSITMLKSVDVADKIRKSGRENIVFVHSPKTAGTNIDYLMKSVSSDSGMVHCHRFSVPRQPNVSPNLFKTGSLGGYPSNETLQTVRAKATQPLFLSGHMPTGLIEECDLKGRYISVVREPVARALSSINFDYQRGYVSKKDKDIETYAGSTMTDNLQTRLIAGKEHMMGECTEDTYCEAVRRIDKDFLFVAPTEDVNSAMAILGNLYGEKKVACARLQVTGEKLYDAESAPEKLISILTQRNVFDTRLYNHVVQEWGLFKDRYVTELLAGNEEEGSYFTLPPEVLNTKQWKRLTAHEIEEHNRKAESSLTCIQQL